MSKVRIGLITGKVFRTGQIVGTGDNTQVVGPGKTKETVIFKETLEDMEDKIIEEGIEMIDIMIIIEAGIDQEKGHSQEIIVVAGDRSSSNSRSRSGSRASTNRDRIRCYKCREYDHFARDCPTSREERDLERLQEMLNMEAKEQTYRQDSPIENHRGPLNL